MYSSDSIQSCLPWTHWLHLVVLNEFSTFDAILWHQMWHQGVEMGRIRGGVRDHWAEMGRFRYKCKVDFMFCSEDRLPRTQKLSLCLSLLSLYKRYIT